MNWNLIARALRLAFLLRVPLAMLLLLAALGPITYNSSMFSNLLDQNGNGWYLFTVSFAAFLLAFTCVATLNLTLVYGNERFEDVRHAGLAQKRPLLTFFLGCGAGLILDTYVCIRARPVHAQNILWNSLFLSLGIIASLLLVIGAKVVQLALTDPKTTPHPPPYLIFPGYISRRLEGFFDNVYCWSSAQSRSLKGAFNRLSQWPLGILQHAGQGYLVRRDASRNEPLRLLAGHVFALTLAASAFFTYLGIGIFKARITATAARVPALAFVLLFLIVACWALSALAFFFDRYRFPLFWALLLLSAITLRVPQSDHFFRVVEVESRRDAGADAERRPVFPPRSSNRTCPIRASGFPTGFIANSRTRL